MHSLPLAAAMAVLSLTAAGQRVPWTGHWKLDEKSGTTAKDSAFHGNDGALVGFTGTPWVKGQLGGALQFDGVDDHVAIGIKKGLPVYDGRGSPYAVTFWVKAPAQDDKRVYSEGNSKAATGFGALFTIGTGRSSNSTMDKLQIFIRNDRTQNIINWQGNTTVFDDKWHHVAWVDNAGLGELYVDGVKDTRSFDYTAVARSPRTTAYGEFTMDRASIGAVLRGSACCLLRGVIDDVRTFATILRPADIKVIMSGGPGPACHASIGIFGVGCGAGPLALDAGGSAMLNGALTLQLRQGSARHAAVLLAGGPLAVTDLGRFGIAGCRLYTPLQGLTPVGIGTLDSQGNSVKLALKVPNNTSLLCGVLSFQGATLGGSPLRYEFSNGATILFGN